METGISFQELMHYTKAETRAGRFFLVNQLGQQKKRIE